MSIGKHRWAIAEGFRRTRVRMPTIRRCAVTKRPAF
jgi:hypothetical protein